MSVLKTVTWVFVAGIAILSSGCASSPPHAEFRKPLASDQHVRVSDTIKIEVQAAPKVQMTEIEKTTLAGQIQSTLTTKQSINPPGDPRDLRVDIKVTRFEKGNAFARAMLAGLGQIHLDAEVNVIELPGETTLTTFVIAKTFAWGGIYGASTRIEDLEGVFADGIASALVG